MPSKRYVRRTVEFLDRAEMDALVAAPNRSTWVGRRDYAILIVALQTASLGPPPKSECGAQCIPAAVSCIILNASSRVKVLGF
jgi:hypothetical protein